MAKRKSDAERMFEAAVRRKSQSGDGGQPHQPDQGGIPGGIQRRGGKGRAAVAAVAAVAGPGQPSHAVAPMPAGGLVIGYELRPPHSLRTAKGKPCRTDRWFDRCGLVYDSSQPDEGPMGYNNPRLFLAGTAFRCYYPNSTRADFAAIMSSGSSGRWLNSWGQKSNYIQF